MNQILTIISSLALTIFVSVYFFGLDNSKSLKFYDFYKNSETAILKENLSLNVDLLLKSRLSSEQLYLLAADLSSKEFYDQSSKVYKEFINNYPNLIDSDIYARYAESLYLENLKVFNEFILENIENSLFLDPSNYKALTLKGLFFYNEENYQESLKHWAIALDNVESDEEKKSLIIVMNSAIKALER